MHNQNEFLLEFGLSDFIHTFSKTVVKWTAFMQHFHQKLGNHWQQANKEQIWQFWALWAHVLPNNSCMWIREDRRMNILSCFAV